MKKILPFISAIVLGCTTTSSEKTPPSKTYSNSTSLIWESSKGFVHPESVIYYADSNYLFISNIGNDESNETPNGFISKVDLQGNILSLKWVDSIRSPKGQCLANGKYYVSALDELLEINLASGEIINAYTLPQVAFLNDVTADKAGNIYVSGMRENSIYKLDTSGNFSQWFQNDSLHHPNGLLAVDDLLFIGGWGNMEENETGIDTVGHFMVINQNTKNFGYLTPEKAGKLDGIQPFGDNLLVSSWKAGAILEMKKSGEYSLLMNTPTSVGDILYLATEKLLIVPLNFQHKVVAYKLPL